MASCSLLVNMYISIFTRRPHDVIVRRIARDIHLWATDSVQCIWYATDLIRFAELRHIYLNVWSTERIGLYTRAIATRNRFSCSRWNVYETRRPPTAAAKLWSSLRYWSTPPCLLRRRRSPTALIRWWPRGEIKIYIKSDREAKTKSSQTKLFVCLPLSRNAIVSFAPWIGCLCCSSFYRHRMDSRLGESRLWLVMRSALTVL